MAKCESVRALSRQIFVAPLRWQVMPTVSVLFRLLTCLLRHMLLPPPSLALFLSLSRSPNML